MRCHVYTTESRPYRVLLTSEGLIDLTHGANDLRVKASDIKFDYSVRACLTMLDGTPRRLDWGESKVHKDISAPSRRFRDTTGVWVEAEVRKKVEGLGLYEEYLQRPGVAGCKYCSLPAMLVLTCL